MRRLARACGEFRSGGLRVVLLSYEKTSEKPIRKITKASSYAMCTTITTDGLPFSWKIVARSICSSKTTVTVIRTILVQPYVTSGT